MPRPLLVTGFAPFDGRAANPSQDLVLALDGVRIGDRRIVGRVLPVLFRAVPTIADMLTREVQPAAILATGQAAGEASLRLECFAVNALDSRTPDETGVAPDGEAILAMGPVALATRLDRAAVLAAIRATGVPARLSFHAGTHCCNLLFYRLLATTDLPCGFLHLPPIAAERPDEPVLAREAQLAGVRAALEAMAVAVA
jgi:pyroglutamyl-peptidase